MQEYKVNINELYNIARRAGCKNKTEIAIKMHMNRNTVGKVLEGKELPSSTFMYKFIAAFDVSEKDAGPLFFNKHLRNT